MKIYINSKIINLQKKKNKTNNILHKLRKSKADVNSITFVKEKLELINLQLKMEFRTSINAFWEKMIKRISLSNSNMMFPEINRIFRSKAQKDSDILTLKSNKLSLFTEAKIESSSLPKDKENNILVTNEIDKLNLLGAHFADVNVQNKNLGEPEFTEMVNKEVSEMEQVFFPPSEVSTVTIFSRDNCASNPKFEDDSNFFSNFLSLELIFRRLNNKKSSGVDNVPNFILRKLPDDYIKKYNILFNNILNNR